MHAHKDEDLSRRDDLWSWLYMLAELLEGEGRRAAQAGLVTFVCLALLVAVQCCWQLFMVNCLANIVCLWFWPHL